MNFLGLTILALSYTQVTLIILALAVLPIMGLMVYAIIVAIRNSTKRAEARKQEISETHDESQAELFFEVYGGRENIVNVERQLSRVSVTVNDVEKVEVEKLQELGASGVLIVGNMIKCSYGDRATYIFNILNEGESNE